MSTALGWTYAEIDLHTLPQVKELLHYWRRHPPTHLMLGMIGRALGLKPGEGRESALAGSQNQAAAWRDLRQQAADPMSGLSIRGDAPE